MACIPCGGGNAPKRTVRAAPVRTAAPKPKGAVQADPFRPQPRTPRNVTRS
jgi:hypothetical protein